MSRYIDPHPASQIEEYDDLLLGLGSDDMNDFDGLDDMDETVDHVTLQTKKSGMGIDVFDGQSGRPSLA